MANANLHMYVNAHTYILGLNERYVMHTKVAYVQEQHWQQQRQREGERQRERERETTIKHRGLYGTFVLWKGTAWKKQDHSLQSSILVKIKNIVLMFNFDIVLKSVVGMQ